MSEETISLHETISLPYTWSAGAVGTKFLKALKDKKIMGTVCPRCRRVLVPARRFCPRCFVDTTEWVEVGDKGTLKSFTLINYSFTGQPKNPPYLIGMIQLDKADTCLFHFLGGIDLSDIEKACKHVRIGMRVQALWKEKREGKITDIEHFEPIIEG